MSCKNVETKLYQHDSLTKLVMESRKIRKPAYTRKIPQKNMFKIWPARVSKKLVRKIEEVRLPKIIWNRLVSSKSKVDPHWRKMSNTLTNLSSNHTMRKNKLDKFGECKTLHRTTMLVLNLLKQFARNSTQVNKTVFRCYFIVVTTLRTLYT